MYSATLIVRHPQNTPVDIRLPRVLYPLNGLHQIGDKSLGVLRSWEVTQSFHRLVHCAVNLICCLLAHLGCVRPVVLARQHVYRALLAVDLRHPVSSVPASEVEIKVAVEDAVCLGRVEVPDELLVLEWCHWCHHLYGEMSASEECILEVTRTTYPVNPLGVEQRLIDIRRSVVPLALSTVSFLFDPEFTGRRVPAC